MPLHFGLLDHKATITVSRMRPDGSLATHRVLSPPRQSPAGERCVGSRTVRLEWSSRDSNPESGQCTLRLPQPDIMPRSRAFNARVRFHPRSDQAGLVSPGLVPFRAPTFCNVVQGSGTSGRVTHIHSVRGVRWRASTFPDILFSRGGVFSRAGNSCGPGKGSLICLCLICLSRILCVGGFQIQGVPYPGRVRERSHPGVRQDPYYRTRIT